MIPESVLGRRFGRRVCGGVLRDESGRAVFAMVCDCGDVSLVRCFSMSFGTKCESCRNSRHGVSTVRAACEVANHSRCRKVRRAQELDATLSLKLDKPLRPPGAQ